MEKDSALYALEIRIISMYNENNIKKEQYNTFTVRLDETMQDMVTYLQEKKLLNKTSIIRLAIAELYNAEKAKECKGSD